MSGKSSSLYQRIFDELESQAERLQLSFEPRRITSDFEKSLLKAVASRVSKNSFISQFDFCRSFLFSFQIHITRAVTFITLRQFIARFKIWV
jgi:hypothetical protein